MKPGQIAFEWDDEGEEDVSYKYLKPLQISFSLHHFTLYFFF